MTPTYQEPLVSFLVGDFVKPVESRLCLESIRRHVRFPHKVIYHHNGTGSDTDYAYQYLKDGLVDQFIQTKVNNGLGIGTRDLFAASFSPYSILFQNDQILAVDFTQEMLDHYIGMLWGKLWLSIKDKPEPQDSGWTVASVSLAGQVAGPSVYSERAHLIKTDFYRHMESSGILGYHGAGPYNDGGDWREAQIQRFYEKEKLMHVTHLPPIVRDNGVWTIRDIAGGRMKMRTDTKELQWIKPPTETGVFPDHTDEEWTTAIAGNWVPGTTPVNYIAKGQVFNCWGNVG